jgi:hypothetical protein
MGLQARGEVPPGTHDVLQEGVEPHAEPGGKVAVRLVATIRDPSQERLARLSG